MFRRSRSQSLSTADRNRKVGKNVNNFKRSGSVQDLKVLGGKKDMLNKKKTKLTRQESVDIRNNDEGKNTNLTPFLIWQVLIWCSPASSGYLQSHPELTSALQKLFIHLCTPGQDDPKEIDHCFSAVDFFADKKFWEDNQRPKAGKKQDVGQSRLFPRQLFEHFQRGNRVHLWHKRVWLRDRRGRWVNR